MHATQSINILLVINKGLPNKNKNLSVSEERRKEECQIRVVTIHSSRNSHDRKSESMYINMSSDIISIRKILLQIIVY